MSHKVPFERLRTDHPRLFFNRSTFPAARARALAAGPGGEKSWYAATRSRVERAPASPKVGEYGGLAASAAFCHLVTGEASYLARAKALLEKSVAHYRACDRGNRSVNWYSTSRINAIAAYDWLYDFLDEDDRASLGRDLLDHVEAVQPGRGKPRVHRRNTSGHTTGCYGTQSLLWFAGLATHGSGVDDARSRDYIERGYDLYMKLLEHRRAAAGDDGGSASATLGYAMGAYPWAEFNFFHTMESAFGLEIAPDWPYAAYFVGYVMWNWLPGAREFGTGDAYHQTNSLPQWQMYTHLAQLRHFYGRAEPECAALARWMQGQLARPNYATTWPCHPFLLTRLPQSPPAKPPGAFLPPARHFERMGQIFTRSGSGPGDTYACLTAGGALSQHKHFDENNFVIFRKGFLALDSGTRPEPGSHLSHYYCRTVAHNCILIRMDGEGLPGYWGSPAPGEPRLPTPNDGGMRKTTGAEVVAFETCPEYTYVASDATSCYGPAKCGLALRQFVFVPPDHFVVFDRVTSKKPEYPKTWLLHTAREPEIAGKVFAAEHEEGKLLCRTLLPPDATLSALGGPGKQFWNDGRNWPLPGGWRIKDDVELLGQWRVEVRPGAPRTADVFLHLIEVGDRKTLVRMGPAELLADRTSAGVEFRSGRRTVTVRLALVGPAAGRIKIAGAGKKIDRALATTVEKQVGLTGAATKKQRRTPRAKEEGRPVPPPRAVKPAEVRPQPREEAIAAYDAKLIERLVEETRAGRRPRFFFHMATGPVHVTSADERGGLTVKVARGGTELQVEWRRLSITDRRSLALAVLREGRPDDHCLAAFYLRAAGDEQQAAEHLRKGGDGAAAVEASFE